jgi:hypothetical protein
MKECTNNDYGSCVKENHGCSLSCKCSVKCFNKIQWT